MQKWKKIMKKLRRQWINEKKSNYIEYLRLWEQKLVKEKKIWYKWKKCEKDEKNSYADNEGRKKRLKSSYMEDFSEQESRKQKKIWYN